MTNRRSFLTLGLLGLWSLWSASAGAAPVSVRDARGKVITLAAPPKRIVSIAPSNTEILFALGLGPRIVGVTDYCDTPTQARTKPKVGGVQLNFERIVALKPDLIIAKYDFQKANIARLEKLGQKVFAIDPTTVSETLGSILAVGRVTGTQPRANAVVQGMRRELNRARRIARRDRKRSRTLVVISRKPLIVVGPKTFMDDALRWAGAQNVAHDAKQPYPQFSLESAVARKPEALLMSGARPQDFYNDPVWRNTPAVRNRRVYAPSFMTALERPGPRLATAIRQLAELLHPVR